MVFGLDLYHKLGALDHDIYPTCLQYFWMISYQKKEESQQISFWIVSLLSMFRALLSIVFICTERLPGHRSNSSLDTLKLFRRGVGKDLNGPQIIVFGSYVRRMWHFGVYVCRENDPKMP